MAYEESTDMEPTVSSYRRDTRIHGPRCPGPGINIPRIPRDNHVSMEDVCVCVREVGSGKGKVSCISSA